MMGTASSAGKVEASPERTTRNDEIAAELTALRADVAALAKSIGAYGKARATEFRGSAEAASEDVLQSSRKALKDVRKQIDVLEGDLEARVREHPLQTLMIALGLGFVISLLIRR
jgi:ElaB/YqjD/DUF883 family membrane-anchored ribosome-binding protein